jgi:DNA-binding MarR family transcriptional regulator
MASASSNRCVCTSIRRVSRILSRAFDGALAPTEMSVTQFAVMRAIARLPGEPLRRIADDLSLDRTSLYRALPPLLRRKWIALDQGRDDRSRTARMTSKGKLVLDRAAQRWTGIQQSTVERFGAAAWQRFLGEIERLQACVEPVPA